MPKPLLITDFDGTVIRRDFFWEVLNQLLPPTSRAAWDDFVAHRITHFEALRRIFSQIRVDESRLVELVAGLDLDPAFPAAVRALAARGWDAIVCSAGCCWYIQRVLDPHRLPVEVIANPGTFVAGQGLLMTMPPPGPFTSPTTGIDKAAIVRHHAAEGRPIAFAGDGRPDLAAALLVPAERRFARDWLAEELTRRGEPFTPFADYRDIERMLLTQDRHR